MNTTQVELAKKRLFEKDALNVLNIKLFPGSDRDVTPEKMAEQINKILSHIDAGDIDIEDVAV